MSEFESDSEASGVRSLSTAIKVLRVLDLLASSVHPVRLSDICKSLNLKRGTAYQQIKTLVDSGWAEARDDGKFQLSLRCVSAAETALRQMHLGERVLPILENLVRKTKETASITVIQNGQPVILQRVEANRLIVARQGIGTRLDLLTSASGKIHIAFSDAKVVAAIQNRKALPIPVEELQRIRESKIAFSEPGTGLLAAATPIFDGARRCIAALSLVGLEHKNEIEGSGEHLIAAASEISKFFSS